VKGASASEFALSKLNGEYWGMRRALGTEYISIEYKRGLETDNIVLEMSGITFLGSRLQSLTSVLERWSSRRL
jgi:hypothetical protein